MFFIQRFIVPIFLGIVYAANIFSQAVPASASSTQSMQESVTSSTITPDESLDKELAQLELGSSIQMLPTQMRLPKTATVTLHIPGLDPVVFKPIFGPDDVVKGFESLFPSSKKQIDWGILKIEKGLFKLEDGKLSYSAFADFLGAKARVGIKDFSLKQKETQLKADENKIVEVYRLVLTMTFDAGATVELAGQKIGLKNIDLILEQGKGVELQIVSEIFGQTATLSLVIDSKTKAFSMQGEIKKESIVQIIPELGNTPLKDLSLEGKLTYTAKEGLIIAGTLSAGEGVKGNVSFVGVELHDAHMTINTHEKYALVEGTTSILGLQMKWYCAALFGQIKGLKCGAEVVPGVNDWQPFKASPIHEIESITIHSLQAGFKVGYVAKVAGKDVQKKKKVPISELILKEGEVIEFSGEKGFTFSLYIDGKSTILNTDVDVTVKIDKSQTGFGATLVFGLPKGWNLAESFPELRSQHNAKDPKDIILDIFDLIKLNNARFIASTKKETLNGEEIEPGFNIMADMTLDVKNGEKNIIAVALKDLIKQTGSEGMALQLHGHINPLDIKAMMFKVALAMGSFKFTVGQTTFEGGKAYIAIRGKPEIGFGAEFTMIPTPKDHPLVFSGEFLATPIDFGIAASMQGTWKDPLGIKGFEFGNLGITGTQTWSALEEAVASGGIALFIPATLGIAGDLHLGQKPCDDPESFCGKIRFNIGKKITETAVVVDINNPQNIVALFDILLAQMGAESGNVLVSQVNKLLPAKIERCKLYFVPMGTTIGAIKVEQGIGMGLYLDIMGHKAYTDTMLSVNGITSKGFVSAFKIGVLEMNNADQTCDTTTGLAKSASIVQSQHRPGDAPGEKSAEMPCGPTVEIDISLNEPKFVIDGMIKIGDILQSRTKWYMTSQGITFDTESAIGPQGAQVSIHLKGKTNVSFDLTKLIELKPKDIGLEVTFENKLTDALNKSILQFVKDKQKDFQGQINDAILLLTKKVANQDITNQEATVKLAESRRVWCKDNLSLCLERERIVTAEKIKLAAMEVVKAIEQSPIGPVLKDAMDKLGITALITQTLESVEKVGVGMFEQGEFVFKQIANLVVVNKIHWEGDLSDLEQGVIPSIEVDLTLSGKEVKNKKLGAYNLRDPFGSMNTIVQNIAQIGVDAIKESLNIPWEKILLARLIPPPRFKPGTIGLSTIFNNSGADVTLMNNEIGDTSKFIAKPGRSDSGGMWIPWCNSNNPKQNFTITTKAGTVELCDVNWGTCTVKYVAGNNTLNNVSNSKIMLDRTKIYNIYVDKVGKITIEQEIAGFKPGTVGLSNVFNNSGEAVSIVNNEIGGYFTALPGQSDSGGMWIPWCGNANQNLTITTKLYMVALCDSNWGTCTVKYIGANVPDSKIMLDRTKIYNVYVDTAGKITIAQEGLPGVAIVTPAESKAAGDAAAQPVARAKAAEDAKVAAEKAYQTKVQAAQSTKPGFKPGTIGLSNVMNKSGANVTLYNGEISASSTVAPGTFDTKGMWIPWQGGANQYFSITTKAGTIKLSDSYWGTCDVFGNVGILNNVSNSKIMLDRTKIYNVYVDATGKITIAQ